MEEKIVQSKSITVNIDIGLHSEATLQLISALTCYTRTRISISHSYYTVNGKSLMGVLSLGIVRGDTIEVELEGPEYQVKEAIEKIEYLLSEGLA